MPFCSVVSPAVCPSALSAEAGRPQARQGSAAPVIVVLLAAVVTVTVLMVVGLNTGDPAGPGSAETRQPEAAAAGAATANGDQRTGAGDANAAGTASDSSAAERRQAGDHQPVAATDPNVVPLFDGKTLDGWKVTEFGGQGNVLAKDGQLVLEVGIDLTGVTSTRSDLPRENYEIELDAMRVNGADFFCGLTFPVGEDFCSLILGGWGGGVVGISSLEGMDASENETTLYREFHNGRWYHVRLRVTGERIEAWLDDEQIVDVEREGREISTRSEVDLSQPLGLATWQTTAAMKNIRLRRLPEQSDASAAADSTAAETDQPEPRRQPVEARRENETD